MIRMMVSNSVDPTDMLFTRPEAFATDCTGTNIPNCVFHPSGGGATLTNVPADMMSGSAAGEWYFSANYEILNIGTSSTAATNAGNDVIAFLPGITKGLCDRINEELGISGSATVDTTNWDVKVASLQMDDAAYWATVSGNTDVIGDAAGHADLAGQAFGCLTDNSTPATPEYIYYHVLLER